MNEREVIVFELSRKDSVVALLKILETAKEEDKLYDFIFSIAYIPCEYDEDETNNIFTLGEILKMHVQRFGHNVLNMLYSAETGVWFKMIKPYFMRTLCNPCIGCMAYSHLCRLDEAAMNDACILTGERSHDVCDVSTNYQEIFDFMDEYFEGKGVKFMRPVLEYTDAQIDEEYTKFCVEYGFAADKYIFPKCHLEGAIIASEDGIKDSTISYLTTLREEMDNILDEYRYESNRLQ